MVSRSLLAHDRQLVQIVDAAFAEAARRAGEWLVCRVGCSQCCIGAFAINELDAARLRTGLSEIERHDSRRAERVRKRAKTYLERIKSDFPGDFATGILHEDQHSAERFLSFADDEPCPALDPETGGCDLYASRPLTCRVFGPPLRNEDGNLGVCELCFQGATNEQIADCELKPDPDGLEQELIRELEEEGKTGNTLVAFALAK